MKRAACRQPRKRQPSTSTSRKRQPAFFYFTFLLVDVDHCPFLLVDVDHPALFHWSMSTTALFYWSTLTTALFYWSTALFMTNCIIKQPSCSFLPGRRRPLPFSTSRRQPSCSFLPSRQSTVDSQRLSKLSTAILQSFHHALSNDQYFSSRYYLGGTLGVAQLNI